MSFITSISRILKPDRIYLDYAAATPVRMEVLKKMTPFQSESFANASAIYKEGTDARQAIQRARAQVAGALRIKKEEVFFVSGGTEANNMALVGLLEALIDSGRSLDTCEVVTTALEHPSISEILKQYQQKGLRVEHAPVDVDGLIIHSEFEKLLSDKTVLVTFAYANSEIGVVQDVKAITRAVRVFKKEHKTAFPYVHLDASQAPLYLSCAFDALGVDMMTLDAGKFYGPKGVGIFAKKHGVPHAPLMRGGDQEGGVRPGTENVAGIVGCAEAFGIAVRDYEVRAQRVAAIREYCFKELSTITGVVINGSRNQRIANNVNISIPGIDGEYAAVVLDANGIAVSTKSACSGATGSGSKVIYALGGDDARALSTLRITLGEETTKRNILRLVRVLQKHVAHMRETIDQINKK